MNLSYQFMHFYFCGFFCLESGSPRAPREVPGQRWLLLAGKELVLVEGDYREHLLTSFQATSGQWGLGPAGQSLEVPIPISFLLFCKTKLEVWEFCCGGCGHFKSEAYFSANVLMTNSALKIPIYHEVASTLQFAFSELRNMSSY